MRRRAKAMRITRRPAARSARTNFVSSMLIVWSAGLSMLTVPSTASRSGLVFHVNRFSSHETSRTAYIVIATPLLCRCMSPLSVMCAHSVTPVPGHRRVGFGVDESIRRRQMIEKARITATLPGSASRPLHRRMWMTTRGRAAVHAVRNRRASLSPARRLSDSDRRHLTASPSPPFPDT
jgi:hypothetical protein